MARYVKGNQVTLLRNGAEYFPALASAIDGAEHEIYLQTYIYKADATGRFISDALIRAASRGVKVYMLLDGFGSKSLSKALLQNLQKAQIQVMFYRPKVSPWTFKRNRLRRLHSKVVVIDGRIAFVGGINVIDDMDVPHGIAPRVDYAVQVQGPLLEPITERARRLWRHISFTHFRHVNESSLPERPGSSVAGNMSAAFLVRDNVLHRRDIEHAYLTAIAHARSEIIIANAYFFPGRRFRHALVLAAQRGVKVKLLLQGRMEYLLMYATHEFYSAFLHHGIEIFEYQKSFMHSKVAVIDSKWATVGSSNIDPFSLLLAREANVVVQNAAFASELREDLLRSIEEGAVQIEPKYWRRGRIHKRFISWLMYGFLRFALGLIGYPNKH